MGEADRLYEAFVQVLLNTGGYDFEEEAYSGCGADCWCGGSYDQPAGMRQRFRGGEYLKRDEVIQLLAQAREGVRPKQYDSTPCEVCDLAEISELHEQVERKPYGDMSHEYKPRK